MSQSMDEIRRIVTDRQAQEINGVLVGMQTANAIVTVYDTLSLENKAKFEGESVERMGCIACRLVA